MERIILKENSFEKILIDSSKELEITVEKNISVSLYVHIQKSVCLKGEIHLCENASLNLLIWNESDHAEVTAHIDCDRNARMELNLGELSEGSVKADYQICLKEEYSSLKLFSAAAVSTQKHFNIECIHEAPHTVSEMENYAVVYENGDFKMIDTGTIKKGSYQSESHQTSRALILSEHQKCEIEPVLLIDENDVQASHATGMGQIDENQLYYLQSRGLSQTQALGLITIGYLMPIAHVLEDEKINQELSEKIERKVGLS